MHLQIVMNAASESSGTSVLPSSGEQRLEGQLTMAIASDRQFYLPAALTSALWLPVTGYRLSYQMIADRIREIVTELLDVRRAILAADPNFPGVSMWVGSRFTNTPLGANAPATSGVTAPRGANRAANFRRASQWRSCLDHCSSRGSRRSSSPY